MERHITSLITSNKQYLLKVTIVYVIQKFVSVHATWRNNPIHSRRRY